jgi:hypothetical protein
MRNTSHRFIKGSRANDFGLEPQSLGFTKLVVDRNGHMKETAEPGARRSLFIGIDTDDHFPEGNSCPQNVTIWEEFATLRRQRANEYPLLWSRDKETGRMAAITRDYP